MAVRSNHRLKDFYAFALSYNKTVCPSKPRLEFIDLIGTIPQILQHTRQLALLRRTLLIPANRLIQPGGPAHKDLDTLLLGLRQHRLEQLGRDVSLALRPALGRVIEDVKGAEAVGEGVFEVLELGFEEDVGFGEVAEDEGDFGLVRGVFEDGAGELVHSVFGSRRRSFGQPVWSGFRVVGGMEGEGQARKVNE